MEQHVLWDLYCFQCSMQFEKRSLYDLHQLIIHNYKSKVETVIKSEPAETNVSNIQSEQVESQAFIKNVSKEKKLYKCKICDYSHTLKGSLKKHIAFFHEGKKPFKCESC